MSGKLRVVVAGCGRMGRSQAQLVGRLPEFALAGVCDPFPDSARAVGEACGVPWFTAAEAMIAACGGDVMAVCSDNASHAGLTLLAARHGYRAVYCEKPMATNLGDARAMVAACERAGTLLAVNHQRRLGPDLVAARRLLDRGAVGELRRVRTNNQGDILSDGTHAVDSVLWLAGDPAPEWVFGQVHRELAADPGAGGPARPPGQPERLPGTRYGHVVENGGTAVVQFANGVRAEMFFGDLVEAGRAYQDYEIFGTAGALWRAGDKPPNLFATAAAGGGDGGAGMWRPVPVPPPAESGGIGDGYRLLAHSLRTGEPHPLRAEIALRGFEIVMGIYESARVRRKLRFPVVQDRFPLELMIAETAAGGGT